MQNVGENRLRAMAANAIAECGRTGTHLPDSLASCFPGFHLAPNNGRFAQQKLVGSEKCSQPNSIIRVDQC